MGATEHRQSAESQVARCAIFTVSDSKTEETDESGKLAFEILSKYGQDVVDLRVVKNDRKAITAAVVGALGGVADLVVTVGGTGISKKDLTIDALEGLIVKKLPGFGELFRAMSAKEIGTASILSRAMLGVTEQRKLVVALPGSPAAVKLGLKDILVNELKHLLWELRKP